MNQTQARRVLRCCRLIEEADRLAMVCDGTVPVTAEMMSRRDLQQCLTALWSLREAAAAAAGGRS